MVEIPDLYTKRLILKPLSKRDETDIQHFFNDWDIIKHIGSETPWPYPDDGAKTYLNTILPKMVDEEVYAWAIRTKNNPGTTIGVIEYRFLEDKDDNRGFWLAKSYWKKGFMSEAIERTQDFIFFDLEKDKLTEHNAPSNKGSKQLKKKYGWRFIGIKHGNYHTGEKSDEIWELTRHEWRNFRNKLLESKKT